MTGYAQLIQSVQRRKYFFNIKSVNNKFLSIKIYLPNDIKHLENFLKESISEVVKRGTVEISIKTEEDSISQIDNTLLEKFRTYVENIENQLNRKISYNLKDIHYFVENYPLPPEDSFFTEFKDLFSQLLQLFLENRQQEGNTTEDYLRNHLQTITELHADISARVHISGENFTQKFNQFLSEKFPLIETDDPRITRELAILLQQRDITEELERIAIHVKSFYSLFEQDIAVGKHMNFLVQELARETNTLNTKSHDIEISQKSITIKSELEKIREQIQNIE